jgi:hypothetical protein
MQTLKRKCSLAKNPSKQAIQTYSACALVKSLQWVAFKTDGRQTGQVLEKELRPLDSVWGEEAHNAK